MLNTENIPKELRKLNQWVAWEKEHKIPINPMTGANAGSNDPKTWGSFEAACKYWREHQNNGIGGIGFVFSKDDPYCGLDADHCIQDRRVNDVVDDDLFLLNTYCEKSPSGKGVHAILEGKLPGAGLGPKAGRRYEMYDQGRYFTVTGEWLGRYGSRIQKKQLELNKLYAEMANGEHGEFKTPKLTHDEIREGVKEGYRNNACTSMAGRCLSSGMSYQQTLEICCNWNEKNNPPLDKSEVVRTVQSIAKREAAKSFRDKKKEKQSIDKNVIIECLYSNEDGDADLFKEIHGDNFIFDHAAQNWGEWQGHHWNEDTNNGAFKSLESVISEYQKLLKKGSSEQAAARETIKTARGLDYDEAAQKASELDKHQKALKVRISKLKGAARKKNVLWCATLGEGLTGNEWDQKPWLLPCENGVIDLRTGKMETGRQSDFLKTSCPVRYDPAARAPTWDLFINSIFDGKKELINYVQTLVGYGITGITSEDVLPIFCGSGRNGKTIFFEILKSVLGDLAHKTKTTTLLDTGRTQASGSADADLCAFKGKRLIWAAETNDGTRLNVGKIKELTGSDTLNARAPFARRAVEFRPTHLLCLITNNLPSASSSDFALWERVALVPFHQTFVRNPTEDNEKLVDRDLFQKLLKELPGVLNWMVHGCLRWQKHGLNPPAIVQGATSAYKKRNDLLGEYIAERCLIDNACAVQARKIHEDFQNWCRDYGHDPLNGTRFGQEMGKLYTKEKRRNRAFYIGIDINNKY